MAQIQKPYLNGSLYNADKIFSLGFEEFERDHFEWVVNKAVKTYFGIKGDMESGYVEFRVKGRRMALMYGSSGCCDCTTAVITFFTYLGKPVMHRINRGCDVVF